MGTHYPLFLPFKEIADSNLLTERRERERKKKERKEKERKAGRKKERKEKERDTLDFGLF